MTVVLSLAILLLTAAVVLLYAMMGELASRIPAADSKAADVLTPLADVRLGASALDWPDGIAGLATRSRAVLLVLSPICTTCDRVAAELGAAPAGSVDAMFGLVVSTGDAVRGAEFVSRHSLQSVLPHHVDEAGVWTTGNFAVNMSPSALVFEEGVLVEAYSFGEFSTLKNRFRTMTMEGSK